MSQAAKEKAAHVRAEGGPPEPGPTTRSPTASSSAITAPSSPTPSGSNRPLPLEQARHVIDEFVTHYNAVRLHSAIGFVSPNNMLAGRERDIWRERDRKLELAREQRRSRRYEERLAS